jgi:quercetin dioxygenase-like cupin family protein
VDTESARTWNVLGERVTCRSPAEDTGGAYSLFEVVSPPGGGPPLHVHEREDESFYVLAGEFLVRTGDRTFPAPAGAFVRFPRGTAHAYRNVGAGAGRLLVIVSPGGYERFFEAMSRIPVPPDGPPDLAQVMAVARRYGVDVVGPPLGG